MERTTEKPYLLPARLAFKKGQYVIAGTTEATGDAGWTVFICEDFEHARQIMRAYPQARMPCWLRIEHGDTQP